MNEVSKVVLAVLTSVGGISGLIILAIKISVNTIAERLEQKYSLKIDKELEKYKSNLDNKIYISKTKFDTEFNIYRELSKVFFEMVKYIGIMIPSGYAKYPSDEKIKKEYEEENYSKALKTTVAAQDVLNGSAPFIPEDFYMKYKEIIKLCQTQLHVFERRWDVGILATQKEKETFSMDDYKRTSEINEKFDELNKSIRIYLSRLDVLE